MRPSGRPTRQQVLKQAQGLPQRPAAAQQETAALHGAARRAQQVAAVRLGPVTGGPGAVGLPGP